MSICVWFANKDGVPDRSVAARYFETADALLKFIAKFRASPMSATHLIRITDTLSLADERELMASGLLVSSVAYLPETGAMRS